jgi:hypothetical protein
MFGIPHFTHSHHKLLLFNISYIPYEYFDPTKYTVYSKNRKDGYGGVLIAISNEYITSQVTELDTNCEIVWATIKSTVNKTHSHVSEPKIIVGL